MVFGPAYAAAVLALALALALTCAAALGAAHRHTHRLPLPGPLTLAATTALAAALALAVAPADALAAELPAAHRRRRPCHRRSALVADGGGIMPHAAVSLRTPWDPTGPHPDGLRRAAGG